MKKTLSLAGALVFLGVSLFAQSVIVQPYVTLDWDPVYYDPVSGVTAMNYRAFNLDKAGVKLTGDMDKVTVHIEIRGIPPGSNSYNRYDDKSIREGSSYTRPIYSAWGKYQFTKTGALLGGKFKPNFGPWLFDAGCFGIGWRQKIGDAHTLSGYILQPGVTINAYNPPAWSLTIPADRGIRALLLEEYYTPAFWVSGGVAYDYLGNGYNKVYVNASAAYTGIPNLTVIAEGALAVYVKEKGIMKDAAKRDQAENAGLGFGLYVAAEYFLEPVALGTSFKLVDPLAGAAQCMPGDGPNVMAVTAGQFSAATLGVYLRYLPVDSFYIRPQVNIKMANVLNGVTPTSNKGHKTGFDFQLTFHWEPTFIINRR
jgi:hypothetical protein